MEVGDLIRHYDAECGTGIIIEDPHVVKLESLGYATKEDILILWSDGLTEWCDPDVLELVE